MNAHNDPQSYYETAIQQGRIRISEQRVDASYCIKGQDTLTHTVHRHEPAVAVDIETGSVRVVAETDEVVVLDKPATLPVHPCGGYHQNSLVEILAHQFGKLYIVNRLDRLTSGLVILAKSSQVAQQWANALVQRTCEKFYVARVKGKFPCNVAKEGNVLQKLVIPSGMNLPRGGTIATADDRPRKGKAISADTMRKQLKTGFWISQNQNQAVDTVTPGDMFRTQLPVEEWLETESPGRYWFHLVCPTRIAQHKDGVCEAGSFETLSDEEYVKGVKPAHTAFGVVDYDEATDTTVVLCHPITGRTHQIRLHLRMLGHPIANDPNYGGDMWFGNPEGKEACSIAQKQLDAVSQKTPQGATNMDTPATEGEVESLLKIKVAEDESTEDFIRRTCVWCARSAGKDRSMLEFLVRSQGIWLHAFRYSMTNKGGTRRQFQSDLPSWSILKGRQDVSK